jgi:alpha-glucosidase
MLKPLSFIGQNDPETFYRQDEFVLGEHLLICPVSEEKASGRWMYLPEGNWYYFWDDRRYEGEEEVWAEAKLDRVPMFVKEGAVIPMYPIQQYVGEKKIEVLTLHIYKTEGKTESTLYEDAGNGYDYEQGKQNIKTFAVEKIHEGTSVKQEIKGDFEPEYANYQVHLHGFDTETKPKVTIDGNEASLEQNEKEWVFMAPAKYKEVLIN